MSQIFPLFPSARSMVIVRDATDQDLRLMASDMIRYLPDGLFPRLGKRFVKRWMRTFLTQQQGVALVAVTNDVAQQQVGFLIGSTHQIRHVADVLNNHKWSLLLSGAAALSIRPRVLLHFLRTRARPYLRRIAGRPSSPSATSAKSEPATAVITSLVVLPTVRGGGVGTLLVDEFLAQAQRGGSFRAELVTTAGVAGAGVFYEKIGWVCAEERCSKDGTEIQTYRHSLPEAEAGVNVACLQSDIQRHLTKSIASSQESEFKDREGLLSTL
ncbi:GNAT family N-acetyltransferase [Paeniglutamicibacter sp. ZC-3]|uniref:GNAT family N-acetyltransferase n=1 Tax=Paeniglutamicibacter sp. ZC-3 TaxID=2986919 RepID=UPI0021F75E3E|nr:GNAT family N-acetyltransferase [Paeniglutamicibacter sp. ZC-3]MCV9996212.1 GNAT family N-acetyltransferase [Paeniglutamicibacter sp. ZC-3]